MGEKMYKAVHTKLRCIREGVNIPFSINSHDNFMSKHYIKDLYNLPQDLIIDDGEVKTVVELQHRNSSQLTLYYTKPDSMSSEAQLIDKKNGKPLPIHVYPRPKPAWWDENTNKGTRVRELVGLSGMDRLNVWLFKLCSYWFENIPCKFCGVSPTRHRVSSYNPNVMELIEQYNGNKEVWWDTWKKKEYIKDLQDAFEIALKTESYSPHLHLLLTSGNLIDSDFPWKMSLDVGEALSKVIDLRTIDSHINLMPPQNLDYIKKAYDIGFRTLTFNLEVYNSKRFPVVCPGKAKYYGYQGMMKVLKHGRKIFKDGFVGAEFVLGMEPTESLLKGVEDLAKMGISSNANIFIPKSQALWGHKSPPSEDEIITFYKKLGKILGDHNLKALYCQLSLRTSLANEALMGFL